MRFKTEQAGLQHIKNKEMPDPQSWNQRDKKCKSKTAPHTDGECLKKFDEWIDLKQYMFSPEEQIALRGKDHRGRTGKKIKEVRYHHVNTFVDWAENRPRRRAIIIVNANQKNAATQIAKKIDIIGGDHTFDGLGLSSDGKEPASHLWCSWNCSASEWDFFEKQKMPWWRLFELFDGEDVDKVILEPNGLKRIILEPPEIELLEAPKGGN